MEIIFILFKKFNTFWGTSNKTHIDRDRGKKKEKKKATLAHLSESIQLIHQKKALNLFLRAWQ